MRILIVNNHTSRINDLQALIQPFNPTVVDIILAEELGGVDEDIYDLIILSGATNFAVPREQEGYKYELDIIRKRKKPILGICSGFQAIAVAFGSELLYRQESVRGVIDINVINNHPIFGGRDHFTGYVSHKYYIIDPPKNFEVIARSVYNIEAIKHTALPVFGFQFHPEVIDPVNEGRDVFNRFIHEVVMKAC